MLGNLFVDRAAMERELLHALALGPKTHSELEAQAGDSPAHAETFDLVSPFCWIASLHVELFERSWGLSQLGANFAATTALSAQRSLSWLCAASAETCRGALLDAAQRAHLCHIRTWSLLATACPAPLGAWLWHVQVGYCHQHSVCCVVMQLVLAIQFLSVE